MGYIRKMGGCRTVKNLVSRSGGKSRSYQNGASHPGEVYRCRNMCDAACMEREAPLERNGWARRFPSSSVVNIIRKGCADGNLRRRWGSGAVRAMMPIVHPMSCSLLDGIDPRPTLRTISNDNFCGGLWLTVSRTDMHSRSCSTGTCAGVGFGGVS